jgi:heat shock protein HslJ
MLRLLTISLAVLLAACGSQASEDDNYDVLTGTAWQAEVIAGHGVGSGVRSYIAFAEQGRVAGLGACNRFSGTYRVQNDSLRITPTTASEIECSPSVMEQEARFLAAIEETQGYEISDDGLLVLIPSPSGTPTHLAPRRTEAADEEGLEG